jgi:clan AA aspartic protease (TIGR02281 family)
MMKIAIAIFLVCIFHSAAAQTYKCVQSGRTVYSEIPCDGNATLVENHVSTSGGSANSITLTRDATGRFSVPGSINGMSTIFTVDTGASFTTISGDFASKLGIHSCVPVGISHTANGDTPTCRVAVSSMSVGGFNYANISVLLNPTMQGSTLLGNDLLSRLKVSQQGNIMVLSQ